MTQIYVDPGKDGGSYVTIKHDAYVEMQKTLEDLRVIAREQENAHINAKMECGELRAQVAELNAVIEQRNGECVRLHGELSELERRLTMPLKLPPKMNVKMGGDKQSRALFGGINMGINDCAKALMEIGFNVVGYPVEGIDS